MVVKTRTNTPEKRKAARKRTPETVWQAPAKTLTSAKALADSVEDDRGSAADVQQAAREVLKDDKRRERFDRDRLAETAAREARSKPAVRKPGQVRERLPGMPIMRPGQTMTKLEGSRLAQAPEPVDGRLFDRWLRRTIGDSHAHSDGEVEDLIEQYRVAHASTPAGESPEEAEFRPRAPVSYAMRLEGVKALQKFGFGGAESVEAQWAAVAEVFRAMLNQRAKDRLIQRNRRTGTL